jgi:hypothetical protein
VGLKTDQVSVIYKHVCVVITIELGGLEVKALASVGSGAFLISTGGEIIQN